MFDTLLLYYANYFSNEENKDCYLILKSKIAIEILSSQYQKWIKTDGILPIEKLSEEDKKKYWDIAGKYQQDQDKRILATKSAYALNLMIEI